MRKKRSILRFDAAETQHHLDKKFLQLVTYDRQAQQEADHVESQDSEVVRQRTCRKWRRSGFALVFLDMAGMRPLSRSSVRRSRLAAA